MEPGNTSRLFWTEPFMPSTPPLRVILLAAASALLPSTLLAQSGTGTEGLPRDLRNFPRPSIQALPTPEPVRLDGILDEEVWSLNPPAGGFVQAEPREGEPATEPTEVWVAYDDDNLYVAAWLHDSEPGGLVVNDIKRDFDDQNQDVFSVILDTFADHRNGYVFMTNPGGARGDRQVANEGREINTSWDAIWLVETQRTAAELDLPPADFVKTFWTGKGSYSFSRNMFVDALVQYDPATEQFNSNLRFNLIHHPLSDLYIVWNEQRFFTGEDVAPGRSLTIKVTQMVAF